MNPVLSRVALLACFVSLPALSSSGCVISDGGDDDGAGTDGGTDDPSASATDPSASASASATDPSATASASDSASATNVTESATDATASATNVTESATDATASATNVTESATDATADDTGDTGADVTPQDGGWQYEESGGSTNDCTFIAQPSNGFGVFQIAVTGEGTLTLTPGDETDPFECTFGGGSYDCAERLTGMTDQVEGLDAVGNILVSVDGEFQSSTELSGTQNGRIECEGSDCGVAESALGVTFPCEFTVPFTATAV